MSRREGTAGLGEEQLGCCGLPNIACLAPHSDVMRRLLRRRKCERGMASHRGGLHQRVGRCQGGGLGDAPSKSCVLAPRSHVMSRLLRQKKCGRAGVGGRLRYHPSWALGRSSGGRQGR